MTNIVTIPGAESRVLFPNQIPSMIALLQRVTSASVTVAGETVGAIDAGLLVLLAVEPGDGEAQAQRMCERLLGYRVFADADGRMNLSLADTGGGLLLVPQFTLAADTRKGMRPGFTTAAPPGEGRRWFERLVELARAAHPRVATGRFGAHMQVRLVNDGPVTFMLRS
jgi:D-tyrosyl-tRNA(Tyr) deacylase